MDTIYPPTKAIDGKKYDVSELNVDRRPFKAYLDFGLARATKGNRIFGALKGVTDGGLYVPHDIKKFPGYTFSKEDDDGGKYDPKVHRDKIFGVNIDKYM